MLIMLLVLKLSTTREHRPKILTFLNFIVPSSTDTGASTFRSRGICPVCCCCCSAAIMVLPDSLWPVKGQVEIQPQSTYLKAVNRILWKFWLEDKVNNCCNYSNEDQYEEEEANEPAQ